MGPKVEACAQCTQRCLSLHHGNTENSSPAVLSFFKVMIGDFSRVLYLPPKFGPTASNLVHKKAILEDRNRKKWEVTVSTVNGSFAFLEGWNAFSLEHGLKVGNFLVFNYIKGLHFVVQIFDDSAFEKLDFPKNRSQKKRSRSKNDSATKDGKLHRKGSNISVVSEKDVEIMQNLHKEDTVIIEGAQNNIDKTSEYDNSKRGDQDFVNREREDRGPLTSDDISLEIWNKSKDDDVCDPDDECHVSQVEATVCNKDSVLDGKLGKVSPPGTSEFEFTVRNNDTEVRVKGGIFSDRHPCEDKNSDHNVITSTTQLRANKENNFMRSIREVPNCQLAKGSGSDKAAISKNKHDLRIGGCQKAEKKFNAILKSLNAPISHGEMAKEIKKELADVASGVYIDKDRLQASGSSKVIEGEKGHSSCVKTKGHGEILRSVKAEPTDCGNSCQNTAISFVVPNDDQSSLELPTYLPSTKRQRLNMERTVVYLKDNLKRSWPVLYHQHYNLKLLGDGWQAFSTVNNIKPGDECILGVENESDRIYTVDVIRK